MEEHENKNCDPGTDASVSRGSKIARDLRTATNNLTDAERVALNTRGMRLFYAGKKRDKVSKDRG